MSFAECHQQIVLASGSDVVFKTVLPVLFTKQYFW